MKPERLRSGDTVAIVSLSSGVLGEPFVAHEVSLMEKRLLELGLKFKYMPNAKKGIEYLKEHPEARAEDLVLAFKDADVKMVWCAIGGDDTFRTLPYLMNEEFKQLVLENPKIFMGFSDTTNNHLMFQKLGLKTYYGPALLTDVAELGPEMLPYTFSWIRELFEPTAGKEVEVSPVWYKNRESFGPEQVGVPMPEEQETRGVEFYGPAEKVSGKLLGGCIESVYESIAYTRYPEEQKEVFEKYPIFPTREEWRGKIVFLEPSDEKPTPEKFRVMMEKFAEEGVFDEAKGMLFGKPQDEQYIEEYRVIVKEYAEKYQLPTAFNLNFGHAAPRMIVPYGQELELDAEAKKIKLVEPMVR